MKQTTTASSSPQLRRQKRRTAASSSSTFLLFSTAAALLLLSSANAFAPHSSVHHPQRPAVVRKFAPPTPTESFNIRPTSTTTTTTATSLSALPAAAVPLAAITGAVTGGLFSGGLHAIAGPDHLAALLPRCCGQRWYRAGRVGALWGMGHGFSAMLLGVSAFFVKRSCGHLLNSGGTLTKVLSSATHVTEIAVGLSLIVIGAMGMKEAREWEDDIVVDTGTVPQQNKSLSAAVNVDVDHHSKTTRSRAVVFNGLLHGFSWDGAPSLAPAIAVATWSGNLAFLTAYAFGTMTAMAATTTLVGEGTRRAGQIFNRPDIPQKLSLFSSMLAIAIGVIWCGLAFI